MKSAAIDLKGLMLGDALDRAKASFDTFEKKKVKKVAAKKKPIKKKAKAAKKVSKASTANKKSKTRTKKAA